MQGALAEAMEIAVRTREESDGRLKALEVKLNQIGNRVPAKRGALLTGMGGR